MPPPRLDDLPTEISSSIGYLLHRCAGVSYRLVNARLAQHGMEVKHFAILCSLRVEGPRSQGWLGEHLGIDRTTMVQLVDGLEAKGLVERQRNPADRRQYALTLTPAGASMWERARGDVEGSEDDILDGLSETERATLRGLLGRVVQAQEQALPAAGD